MKKLILLLTLAIAGLYSCDKDNDDNNKYLDNKLIEGEWYVVLGKDSSVYTFKNDTAKYAFYTIRENSGNRDLVGSENYQTYKLTETEIIFPKHSDIRWKYKINNKDSISINQSDFWDELKRIK